MSPNLRLVIVLHNHQPIGNFDGVFEAAYQDSYRAFLDVFEDYTNLPIALHTSGSLMEWLAARHPEYLDRLAALVAAGRIEIVGGAFYEPILTMIPPRDRVGQIRSYAEWLSDRFSTPVNGMWIPERVWEQSLTSDLAEAGIQYTVLDDFHFKNAGLSEDELHGYYLTEDDGQLLSVFPAASGFATRFRSTSRKRRSTICGRSPSSSPARSSCLATTAKSSASGPAPKNTSTTTAGCAGSSMRSSKTAAGSASSRRPKRSTRCRRIGKIYIPEGSYREMTEWALPTEQLKEFIQSQARLGTRRPLARSRAVRPRRLLAELQSEVSRNERNVRPDADGQPPPARS